MCRYVYLGVVFRDQVSPGALAHVLRHAEQCQRPVVAIRPEPGGELHRFLGGVHVATMFRCGHCACDWREAEFAGVQAVVRRLLRAADIARIRLGTWHIRNGCEQADRDRHRPLLEVVEIDESELSGVDWTSEVQFTVRRSGPPWPTRKLAHLGDDGE